MPTGGKWLEAQQNKPPSPTAHDELDRHMIQFVVACWNGHWLRFDNFQIAKQTIPPSEHHLIFTSPAELTTKLGIKKVQALGRQFACKSTLELWGKLQLKAFDPTEKYAEIIATPPTRSGPRVKRYKRKLAYRVVFSQDSEAHMNIYGRLPPQACALLDILVEAMQAKDEPVFTEGELQALIEQKKELLNTKQDPWRIFQYYRGKLISVGFLRFHRGAST